MFRAGLTKPIRALLASCVLLALLPGGASAFSKAIWGPVSRNGVNQFPLYHQLGVSIYQADLDWSQVAPTRPRRATDPRDPAYRWPAELSQALTQARRFHMQVMLQIITAPPWANGGHPDPLWAPLHPADYAAFAAAASKQYPDVHLWMVWGEPTRAGLFKPFVSHTDGLTPLTADEQRAPHLYARMVDATYGSLKQISKKNLVIGGNTYTMGLINPKQWIQNLRLPSGRAPRMDMYGHNPFTTQDPNFSDPPSWYNEVQFSDLPRLAGWVDKYLHRGLPLFLSEFTIPTRPDQEFSFYVDPPVAAKWISDAMRLSRQWHRIYALGWIHFYDDPPYSYGGLLQADGTKKPLFGAFARG